MLPRSISTKRLTLRAPVAADAPAVFAGYAQDPEVTRFLTWRPSTTLEQSVQFMQDRIRAWERGRVCAWCILKTEDNRPIGMIELRVKGDTAETGYVLARPEWGKGYMTEALRAVIATGFSTTSVDRITAVCDVENAASARVMAKAGMALEGILPRHTVHPNIGPEPRDVYSYVVTREMAPPDRRDGGTSPP